MANFAEVVNGIVTRVLMVDNSQEARGQDFLANEIGLGGTWLQTSFNGNIRKNYAGIGYTYDEARDAFIPPEPLVHLGLDETTCQWIIPVEEITDDPTGTQ